MQQEIKEKIQKLIEHYQGLSAKEIQSYNEEQTKIHFIQPLFEALGWDFTRDVWPETDVSGQRVDYAFKLNNITKIYIEAKSLKTDLDLEQHAKQAINYAWNKGVTWAILTDFESIKVFNAQADTRSLQDKLVFEISHNDYLADERLQLFSKENFLKNALDDYAVKYGKKLKKLTVDEKLFSDLKIARELLTAGFKTWNKDVNQETLEEGVQRILDRLVFIRVLEDRKLEDPVLLPLLREWQKNKNEQFFLKLIAKFRELDDIYNSNLFGQHACENWEEYEVKWDVVLNLLYGSQVHEYDFSKIPADILGGVYESYLSYIAQNDGKAESKAKSRKKRKEQGIFYTPKFIVDYIVEHTLGEKLKEIRSINELKQLRVLDPTCGSSSFLTKALRAVNDKYKEFGNRGDQYTKSEILLSNIYGVDLDAQAVELAKLNLLIEALDTKAKLPNLTGHVRVGNSLISDSEDELKKYFGESYRDKRPFNWEEEFPEVFSFCHSRAGGNLGFDVIIGNPPWGANIDEEARYLGDKYPNSTKAYKDIYKIFIDKALQLLKPGGLLGFIVPNTFLYQPRYEDIKELVNRYDNYVINLGEHIFSNVQLPSCILIVEKEAGGNKFVADFTRDDRAILPIKVYAVDANTQQAASQAEESIIKNTGLTFDDVFLLKDAGIQYATMGAGKAGKGKSDLPQRIFSDSKNEVYDTPFYTGSNIERGGWYISHNIKMWFRSNYKEVVKDGEWVHFTKAVFDAPQKIIWRQTADTIHAALMDFQAYFGKTIHAALIKDEYKNKVDVYYTLAIFNSSYIDYIYRKKVSETGKVFPQVKLKYLRDLPFIIGVKEQRQELSKLAQKMIELNKELRATAENSDKWAGIKREIEKTDREIDERVFKLYGLGEGEKKIVEGDK